MATRRPSRACALPTAADLAALRVPADAGDGAVARRLGSRLHLDADRAHDPVGGEAGAGGGTGGGGAEPPSNVK